MILQRDGNDKPLKTLNKLFSDYL